MKITEIVDLIKRESPEFLGNMPDRRAALLIRAALAQVAKAVTAQAQGSVRVQGLGGFWVRQVDVEKDGQKTSVRRVIFSVAGPTPGKAVAETATAEVGVDDVSEGHSVNEAATPEMADSSAKLGWGKIVKKVTGRRK